MFNQFVFGEINDHALNDFCSPVIVLNRAGYYRTNTFIIMIKI